MELPYDKLAQSPSVKDEPMALEDPMGPPEEDDSEGLEPELRSLAVELGFSPKQGAALKEFVAACMLSADTAADEPDLDAGY